MEQEENKEVQMFEIRVTAKHKLTEKQMWVCARDFMHRLNGYTTECPEELIGADIGLMPIVK